MPRVIANAAQESLSLDECIAELDDTGFDASDEGSLLNGAKCLARLGRNRDFLGDMLIEQLKNRHNADDSRSAYGPQAIILSDQRRGYFLRGNIWPAESDHALRASGGRSFVYGIPHDHNFDFLTVGYFGPGYVSDYYEYDYEAVAGFRGEHAGLRFVERSALSEGRLLHYRAHRDVHSQLPPESLSVSLNVMATDPAQGWFDQYGFDLESGEISGALNHGANETFLRLAVAMGGEEASDLAAWIGDSHPSGRLRLASYEARSLLLEDAAESDALWRRAELSGDLLVAGEAAIRRCDLETA